MDYKNIIVEKKDVFKPLKMDFPPFPDIIGLTMNEASKKIKDGKIRVITENIDMNILNKLYDKQRLNVIMKNDTIVKILGYF